MVFNLCVFWAYFRQAENGNDINDRENNLVTIALKKLDVNDTILNIDWKFKNDTDHDIWICDSSSMYGVSDFETFIGKDAQTLVIRRRFDLPIGGILERIPTSRYVRLRAGEERSESLSLNVPVRYRNLFAHENTNPKLARRLAIEIGYYDEDLPEMILHILEVGEKLDCAYSYGVLDSDDIEIYQRYYGGLIIQSSFNQRSDFSESINAGGDVVIIPYMYPVLKGEKFLQIEVDGVSIPYKI